MAANKTKTRKKTKAKAPESSLKPRIMVLGHVTGPIEAAGGTALWVNDTADPSELILAGAVDGLLLTGGGDVNPSLYSDDRHPKVYGVNDRRDEREFDALVAAERMAIPVMGICRGSQMINVVFGGTLHQHIPDLFETHPYHMGHDHRVKAAPGSRLAAAWGRGEKKGTRWVRSIHHQAVDEIAPGFVATGFALDGTIEAIESLEGWMLGVQFHPEMAAEKPYNQRIFDRFVAAAARQAGLVDFKQPARPDPKPVSSAIVNPEALKPKVVHHRRTKPDPLQSWHSPVLSRWRCFRCSIDFDLRQDHVDHMMMLHGVDLISEGVTS